MLEKTQWWRLPIFTSKPELNKKAPVGVVMFSGGGGIECGMLMSGIRPVISVEFDPTNPKLSQQMAACHEANFNNLLVRRTVQDVASLGFPGFPRNPDFLHASPVCSNFSDANRAVKGETELDITAAEAVVSAIKQLAPVNFTLEQVVGYQSSRSYQLILNALDGYNVVEEIVNFADFGLPQNRKRLIVRASRKKELAPLIPQFSKTTWYEAVQDLIDLLPNDKLADFQKPFLGEVEAPVLIERHLQRYGGNGTQCRSSKFDERSFTLTKTKLQRGKWGNIALPDGTIKDAGVLVAARLQSFPDWYQFNGTNKSTAGAIIGYSVAPLFVYQMFNSFF
jgi:DNA (cytosine-5)-methyltransferase 1